MNYKIYSFSNSDLNPYIRMYQKKVFDKFNLPLNQIVWEKNFEKYGYIVLNDGTIYYNDHTHFLDYIIKNETTDYLIFFDVDCIPLSESFLPKILFKISDNQTLSGAIQDNDRFGTYVSAWFVGFSRNLYFECECPSITEINTDPFLNFTKECLIRNKNVDYWMPTKFDNYPYGTTYEDLIYHEMQIRHEINHINFINKCKSILFTQ
jgi:hypothetical protein